MTKCYMCLFESDDATTLTRHITRTHRNHPAFRVQCAYCSITYSKWTSFKWHLRSKHANDLPPRGADADDFIYDVNPPGELPGNLGPDAGNRPDENDVEEAQMDVIEGEPINAAHLHKWKMAKFLLNLRENGNITQKALDMVVAGVDEIVRSHVDNIQAKMMEAKQTPDSDALPVNVVNDVLQQAKDVSTFDGVHSKYLLDEFLKQEGAVMPQELYLGSYPVFTKTNPPRIVEKKAFAYYVPLDMALQQIVSHPELLNYIENPPADLHDDVIRDVRDGSWFKTHPLFSVDPRALIILFSWDDLQTTNIAGSKIHKFSMCYWTLGNIPPHLRSLLRAINVYAIAKTSDLKRFGSKIFSTFAEDIKKLREGLALAVNGQRQIYRGSLLFVSADTPAAQLLGGFKESVGSAHSPCRNCKLTREEIQEVFVERAPDLRNKASHEEEVRVLEDETITEQARQYWSKAYGITKRSEFSGIEDFDITQCLVQDPMHVFMEGTLPLDIRHFLRYVVLERGLVQLGTINVFLAAFDSGHLKTDHPSPIERNHLDNNLRQSSMQSLALGHILPFALKPHIESDPDAMDRLNNLVLLMQIINLCFSFEFADEDVSLLERMIQTYLTRFKILYPDVNLVPKHHYMTHLPRQIVKFGPLRYQWCLRYEAAHAYFKRLMSIVLSYKNPAFTMLYRHCCKRANLMLTLPGSTDDKFLDLGDEVKKGPSVQVIDHAFSDMLRANLPIRRGHDVVLNANAITVKGIRYEANKSVLLLNYPEDDLPVFGRVELITVYGQEKILFYRILPTLYFDSSLNAYRVSLTNNVFGGMSVRNLRFPHVHSLWRFGSGKYVVLTNFKPEFTG